MINFYINVSNIQGTILGKLDLSSDSEVNIVYQLSDIKEPEKRSDNFSLPFTIPGSKNNNQILQPLFLNGYTVTNFDPRKVLYADIILNEIQIFSGELILTDVIKNGTLTEYEIQISSHFASLFSKISSDKLIDTIDLSKYNHPWNREHIVKSWDTAIKVQGGWQGFSKGTGYVYPGVHQGETNDYYNITSYRPWIYAKTILDETLNKYGFKYNSSFLNSESFKSLVISPNPNGDKLLESLALGLEFKSERSNELTLTSPLYTNVANVKITGTARFDVDVKDTNNTYNNSTGVWKVQKNGKYKLIASFGLITRYIPDSPILYYINTSTLIASCKFINQNKTILYQKNIEFVDNGTKKLGTHNEQRDVYLEFESDFNKNDEIRLVIEWSIPSSPWASRTITITGQAFKCPVYLVLSDKLSDNSKSRFYNVVDSDIAVEDEVNLNRFLPDMTTQEFILGLNKMFNLYWQRLDDNTYIIEPRDDFYNNSNKIIDLSRRVRRDDNYTITPLAQFQYSKYKFSYSEDTDFWNSKYKDTYNTLYGSKTIEVDSDLVEGSYDITLPFAPTPLYKPFKLSSKTLSSFFTIENDTRVPYSPKTRILFYQGLKSVSNSYKIYDNSFLEQKANGQSVKYYVNTYNCFEETYTKFPYVGHLYDYDNSTLDLNFGICETYYFPFTNFGNDTLFNRFWRNYIAEITDKDSHLLTFNATLNHLDFSTINLRDIYQVDNVYYRINKFTYNPRTFEAKFELYKALDYQPFIPSVISSNTSNTYFGSSTFPSSNPIRPRTLNGTGVSYVSFQPYTRGNIPSNPQFTYVNNNVNDYNIVQPTFNRSFNDKVPTYKSAENTKDANNNRINSSSARVRGTNNKVDNSTSNVTIQGNNNNIMSETSNVTIVGDNNTVLAGIQNVTIIGNNVVATKSNYSYINGVELFDGKTRSTSKVYRSTTNGKLIRGGIDSASNGACIFRSE